MPEEAARRAVAELETLVPAEYGPVTARLDHMAYLGVEGLYDAGVLHAGRVVALPAEVCAVLEAHPDALWSSDFSCEGCGLETPHRSPAAMREFRDRAQAEGRPVNPGDRTYMVACPLCGGRVRWAGFTGRRHRAAWERRRGA